MDHEFGILMQHTLSILTDFLSTSRRFTEGISKFDWNSGVEPFLFNLEGEFKKVRDALTTFGERG